MYRQVRVTLINATMPYLSYMNNTITKLIMKHTETKGIKYSCLNKFVKISLSELRIKIVLYTIHYTSTYIFYLYSIEIKP